MNRVRQKSSELSTDATSHFQFLGSGVSSARTEAGSVKNIDKLVSVSSTLLPARQVVTRTSDFVTPRFGALVRDGEFRPINEMHRIEQGLDGLPPFTDFRYSACVRGNPVYEGPATNPSYRTSFVAFNWSDKFNLSPRSLHDVDDINALALEAKAATLSAGMDYATSLVEWRKTVGMFNGVRDRLMDRVERVSQAWSRDLAQKKRNGKFKGFRTFKEAYDSFSAFWLEYRFGWRILYYDLQSLSNYIRDMNEEIRLFTRRERSTKTEVFKTLVRSVSGNPAPGSFIELWREEHYSEQVGVGYSAKIDPSVLGNPMAFNTLWEITPWSLVVEMFFNVQNNIISASKMPIGVEPVPDSGFLSRRQQMDVTWYINSSGPITWVKEATTEHGPSAATAYHRTKLGSPDWDISFQPNLNLGKIVDLIALMGPLYRIFRRFQT